MILFASGWVAASSGRIMPASTMSCTIEWSRVIC